MRARALRAFLLPLLVLAAACGGGGGNGGGGGGGGGNPTPTPPPGSSATPRPSATPSPTPTSGERAHVVLAESQTVAGIDVSDIEDASLNDAGAVAVIVTARGTDGKRAVLVGDTTGEFSAVVSPATGLAGDDLLTLARVRLSETGAAIFESGEGLDTDRLYFTSDDAVTPLAGAAPGLVAPEFRILGDVVIGGDGTVGFIGGGDPCRIDTTGPSPRTLCELHLYVARDGVVEEVEADGVVLREVSPTQPQVAVVDTGVTFFSVPPPSGMPEAPSLLRYADGDVDTVLAAATELPDVGRLQRPQVAAANADEQLLLTTTLAADPGPSRPTVLGILDGEDFTVLDREREEVGEGTVINDLRAVGIDESGRALYLVRIGEPEDTEAPLTLRLKGAGTSVDVATERAVLPGTDKTLISIESQRINRRGDVAFIAELGRIEGMTTIIEEVRAVVRLAAGGRYVAPISSLRPGNIGTLSNFEIAGFDDNANLLLIATRAPSQTVLVYAPPLEP